MGKRLKWNSNIEMQQELELEVHKRFQFWSDFVADS